MNVLVVRTLCMRYQVYWNVDAGHEMVINHYVTVVVGLAINLLQHVAFPTDFLVSN